MDDLALQVGIVDDIIINKPDAPHTRGGEIQRHRGAQPAGADDQDGGGFQPALTVHAHLRDEQVARVAHNFFVSEFRQHGLGLAHRRCWG